MKQALFNDLVESLKQAAAHAGDETVSGLRVQPRPPQPTSSPFAGRPASRASNSPPSWERLSARCENGNRHAFAERRRAHASSGLERNPQPVIEALAA